MKNDKAELEQYQRMYLYKRIVQAKLYIDMHFSENIDVSNIADEAHFSKFHFIRLFKTIYGKTPHHYLTQVRIDNAKLLLSKKISIFDVSLTVGFDSSTSFTRLFKKHVGVPPSVFQDQLFAKQAAFHSNPLRAIPNCFAETHGLKNSNFG